MNLSFISGSNDPRPDQREKLDFAAASNHRHSGQSSLIVSASTNGLLPMS